jgi:hypothetical protein
MRVHTALQSRTTTWTSSPAWESQIMSMGSDFGIFYLFVFMFSELCSQRPWVVLISPLKGFFRIYIVLKDCRVLKGWVGQTKGAEK